MTTRKDSLLYSDDFWVGKSGENAAHFRNPPMTAVLPNEVRNL